MMRQSHRLVIAFLIAVPSLAVGQSAPAEPANGETPAATEEVKPDSPTPGTVTIISSGRPISDSAKKLAERQGTRTTSSAGNVSFAELVRATEKAKKAREAKAASVPSITNETLVQENGTSKSDKAKPSTAPSRGPAPDSKNLSYETYTDDKNRGEQWWRDRMASSQKAITDLEAKITKLESDIAGLQNAFYAQDDPAYRDGVLKPKWDSSLIELEKTRQALAAAKSQRANLEEEARRSGALPGWFR